MRVVTPENVATLCEAETLSIRQAHLVYPSVSVSQFRRWCENATLRAFRVGPRGNYHIIQESIRALMPKKSETPKRAGKTIDEILVEIHARGIV